MSNRKSSQQNQVRLWLAALKLRRDLLHLRLKANFNPNQARVPAGNPDGGRWTDDGGRTADSTSETGATQRVVRDRSGDKPWRAYAEQRRVDGSLISTTVYNRDGSVIVSERPNAATERNTVTLRDGARFIFENSGDTQRIYDAAGNLISSAAWTPDGPVAQPIVQQALFDSQKRPSKRGRLERVIDAALAVYNWWLGSGEAHKKEEVVAWIKIHELSTVEPGSQPISILRKTREEAEILCPKLATVQEMTNRAAKSLNRNMFVSDQGYGTAVHVEIKRMVNQGDGPPADPDFMAEKTFLKSEIETGKNLYGKPGSVRVDVFESGLTTLFVFTTLRPVNLA